MWFMYKLSLVFFVCDASVSFYLSRLYHLTYEAGITSYAVLIIDYIWNVKYILYKMFVITWKYNW